MDLGLKLKSIRESKKISRKELAEKMNVTPTTITRYENGDRNLNFDTLGNFLINLSDSENEYLKFICSIYMDYSRETTEQNNKLLNIIENYKEYADTWREDFLRVSKYPCNLLGVILDYLQTTEEYYTGLSIHYPEYKHTPDPELQYFTDEQIDDIVTKVTELVKYEIYKIENNTK